MTPDVGARGVSLAAFSVADAPLVDGWLRAEHVRRYWGDPEVNRQILFDPQAGTDLAVIEAHGRKVGLIVWQHPSRDELDEAGLTDIPETVIDIDIMIGDLEAVGRGIGPAAIRLVAAAALANAEVPFVIAATSQQNAASQRAFTKAGFEIARTFDDPVGGRYFLMVKRRDEATVRAADPDRR